MNGHQRWRLGRARHGEAQSEKDREGGDARDEAPAPDDDAGVVATERLDSLSHQVGCPDGAHANRRSGDSLEHSPKGAKQIRIPVSVHRCRVGLELRGHPRGPR